MNPELVTAEDQLLADGLSLLVVLVGFAVVKVDVLRALAKALDGRHDATGHLGREAAVAGDIGL